MNPVGLAALLALPLIVAIFDLGAGAALALVFASLLLIWFMRFREMASKARGPQIVFESITVSHFCEKVRWAMDRLELDYVESVSPGTLRAFYLGKTVPRLRVRTGAAWSSIGNSREILRYLWAEHSNSDRASFLRPSPQRDKLADRLDRAGQMLQVWIYYHIRNRGDLAAVMWGSNDPGLSVWQQKLIRLLVPVQQFLIGRAFRISRRNYERAVQYIEETWTDIEAKLADGRSSILGDEELNYSDYLFAVMTASWAQTPGYGGVNGDSVRPGTLTVEMQSDINRWRQDFPAAIRFTEKLYAERYGQEDG